MPENKGNCKADLYLCQVFDSCFMLPIAYEKCSIKALDGKLHSIFPAFNTIQSIETKHKVAFSPKTTAKGNLISAALLPFREDKEVLLSH